MCVEKDFANWGELMGPGGKSNETAARQAAVGNQIGIAVIDIILHTRSV